MLSHLGSGAVIMRRRLEDIRAGRETPDDFAPSVWDEWNAKTPRAQADDALVADEAVLQALEAVDEGERARLTFPMGPLSLGFDEFAGLRLNEHAFHSWDIAVVLDDDARLPSDAAALVVDNLALIARFSGRADGEERTVGRADHRPRERFHAAPFGRRRGARRRRRRAGARAHAPGRGLLAARLRPARPRPHAGLHR